MSDTLDLLGRSGNTVLTIKIGTKSKNRGKFADNNYRRGASLGGFGDPRQYENEPGPKVDSGDGGGSTGIYIISGTAITSSSHTAVFERLLAVAAGGPGSGNASTYQSGDPVALVPWACLQRPRIVGGLG